MQMMNVVRMFTVASLSLSGCLLEGRDLFEVDFCDVWNPDAGVCLPKLRLKGALCTCNYCGGIAFGERIAAEHTYRNGGPSQGRCPGSGGACTPLMDARNFPEEGIVIPEESMSSMRAAMASPSELSSAALVLMSTMVTTTGTTASASGSATTSPTTSPTGTVTTTTP